MQRACGNIAAQTDVTSIAYNKSSVWRACFNLKRDSSSLRVEQVKSEVVPSDIPNLWCAISRDIQ